MSSNGKQTCISDHLPKMRFGVSDSSNLEQGGVWFSFWVNTDHCCGRIVSVLNNSDKKSWLFVFRGGETPHASFSIWQLPYKY